VRFGNFERHDCHRVGQVAFFLVLAVCVRLAEVHLFVCTSSVSVDFLLCHFGRVGSHQVDCDKPLPGVILSQLSPSYAHGIQYPASSLHGLL